MITDPKFIRFESTTDVVDFVSKGLPPTNRQFTELMQGLRNPTTTDEPSDAGIKVIIRPEDLEGWYKDDDTLHEVTKVLERVHHNRVVNRNIAIAVGAVAVVGGVLIWCI